MIHLFANSIALGQRRRRPCLVLTSALLGAAIVAPVGCTKPAGPVFEPLEAPISWPGPPDLPRIHFVGQIATSEDLKAAKPLGEALRELFAGREPHHGMVSPFAVEFDGQRLFVADTGARVVHMFDLETRAYEQWKPTAPDQFAAPVGLARSNDGRLFVSDSAAGVIWVFDASGGAIDVWGRNTLDRPCGLEYDETHDRLFVADAGSHQVVMLDSTGQFIRRVGSRGVELGSFNFPTDVVLDHDGRLYVSDALNCRIQQFGPDLTPLMQVGSRGDLPGYFSRPKGIAVDSENHLYVVDANFEAVQVYASDGSLLMAFGREGQAPGEFWLPAGICIDGNDRLWIADTYNRRVQVFDYRPPALAQQPSDDSGARP